MYSKRLLAKMALLLRRVRETISERAREYSAKLLYGIGFLGAPFEFGTSILSIADANFTATSFSSSNFFSTMLYFNFARQYFS